MYIHTYIQDVRHGNNRLRRQAAELATQHPEYSDLSRELREGVRESVREGDDIDYKEHPNTSTRYDMRRFDVRMATFINNPLSWTLKIPSAEQLARVGLYYVGMEDRVCCFSCHIELEEWGEDEDPLLRHYMASPHCLFLHQDFSQQLKTLKQQLTTSTTHQSQGYSNTSRRLHSFAQWPYSHIVTSYQLASVGFYYTGEGTKVICFSCGLVVRDWKRGDVPLLVHCRTNPDCLFIKSIIKGAPSSEPSVPTPILKTLTTADSIATNRPNFNDIQIRLKSFKKLSPAFPVSRQQLAEAGLYLLRLPDVMKCFKCSCILQGWVEGDTAVEKHRGASPYCTFLAEKFPSKLSTSLPEVDPNDLPAPQYNEQQLEMMAKQQRPLSQSSTLSTESQLPFHRLSISTVPLIPNTPSSSGYHTMSQLSSTEQSSYASFCGPTSLPSTAYSAKSYPTTPSSMPTPLTHTPDHPNLSSIAEHSLSLSSSTSSSTVGNKSVSLPPSYTHNMTSDPTQSTASALSHQQVMTDNSQYSMLCFHNDCVCVCVCVCVARGNPFPILTW